MTFKKFAAGALASSVLFLAPAAMALPFGLTVTGKIGLLDADGIDTPPINGSAQLAYDVFGIGVGQFALEAEQSLTLSDGKNEADSDLGFETTNFAISFRTLGPIYAIARAGVFDGTATIDNSDTDVDGNMASIGVGFSTGVRTELELTTYTGDDIEDTKYLTLGFGF